MCYIYEEEELFINNEKNTKRNIKKYNIDKRKKMFLMIYQKGIAIIFNIALFHSTGVIIFYFKQDDVLLPNKIIEIRDFLIQGNYDMVTGKCALTDSELNITQAMFYIKQSPLNKSVCGNWMKNLWLGSCMVFAGLFLIKWWHRVYGLRCTVRSILGVGIILKYYNYTGGMIIQFLSLVVRVLISYHIK
ncbi:MAG: glycosyltransferase [Parabacteroides distasonis]